MRFTDIVGQHRSVEQIVSEVEHVKRTGTTFRHTLLFGGPGLGKTTLAKCIAHDLGYQFHALEGGRSWNHERVNSFLLRLDHEGYDERGRNIGGPRHLLLLDEAHSFPVDPWLVPMEQCEVYVGGKVCWLPDFTVVAATTETMPRAFVERCGLELRLQPYNVDELAEIVRRRYPCFSGAECHEIAKRSRGVARIALAYAESVVRNGGDLERTWMQKEVDPSGCRPIDRAYLNALREEGRPLSLQTLCAKLGEEPKVLSQVVEPFLLRQGLIRITSSGRTLAAPNRGPKDRSNPIEAFTR